MQINSMKKQENLLKKAPKFQIRKSVIYKGI